VQSGSRLGPYEIGAAIGAGGMGEVFRARDTRLNRNVAIKLLPAAFAEDNERVARFRREAQVLASLNHPNIAAIHGLEESNGVIGLALELVEGDDLAQRLLGGAIAIDEAISIARQIVDGLEAAHDRGIVHRDLKPANIKITLDGTVKILDFGLAKAHEDDPAAGEASLANSPTMARPMTSAGVILGTAAYMSPEQARGKAVDKRSDIWSFGVVLFEMLTAQRLFAGPTVSDTLAAVLRQSIDFASLPQETPASLRRLLSYCLERDPRHRLRDIGDARRELNDPADHSTSGTEPGLDQPSRGLRLPLVVAALLATVAVTASVVWMLKPRGSDSALVAAPVIRASFPIGATFQGAPGRRQIAISPDGSFIATTIGSRVGLRRIDDLATTIVPGTEGAATVFFSPDSRWIGFSTDTAIRKVPVAGGSVATIIDLGTGMTGGPMGASWADDGRVYYGMLDGIRSVSINGGSSRIVVAAPNAGYPEVLAGSRFMVYAQNTGSDGEIVLQALDGPGRFVLTTGTTPIVVARSEVPLLLLARSRTVYAARLDLEAKRLTADPVSVLQEVATVRGVSQYDVSETGTVVHIPGSSRQDPLSLPRRVTAAGLASPLGQIPRQYSDPRISPDGRHVALHLQDQQDDVWTLDITRDSLTRVTFAPHEDETPAWSPDGQWLAYSGYASSGAANARAIFRRRADGSGKEETLWSLPEHAHVSDWSAEGGTLVIDTNSPSSHADIAVLTLGGTRALQPFLATPFDESSGRISPDGKWLVYRSNESGQDEIYLQAFPDGGKKVQVSTGGGAQPVWSRDGREIYFRSQSSLMVARTTPGLSLTIQTPVPLFKDVYTRPQSVGHTAYDVFPDGTFIFFEPAGTVDATALNPVVITTFHWLQNLPAELTAEH
jgi:serine/threonine-protein kinase